MKSHAPYLVCFGDSLTAGYQTAPGGFGLNPDTPPGGFIQQWLGPRAEIEVTGICGEVTSEMVKRFDRDVVQHQPEVAVILGGTNDLGWEVSPLRICENLQTMYQSALNAGIQPVGVTVPSICLESDHTETSLPNQDSSLGMLPPWAQAYIDKRFVLNQKIEEICKELNLKCLDLFSETAEGPYQLLASRFASDGLHFNTAGYEAFGRLIWKHVLAETFGEGPRES